MVNKSYMGKGTVYLEEIGASDGALSVGNCSEVNLALNEDKKEQKDFEGAGGAVVNTVSRIDTVTGTLTALDMSAKNLAKALRALITTVAGAAIVSEAHAGAISERFTAFDRLRDTTVAVVVTGSGGTPTYVAGDDYILKNNGVEMIAAGTNTFGATGDIEVSYTGVDEYVVETLLTSGVEYKMTLDFINEADNGKPILITIHRVKINPAQALNLITEDFGTLPMTFDILKDDSIVGSTESKFFKIQMNQ